MSVDCMMVCDAMHNYVIVSAAVEPAWRRPGTRPGDGARLVARRWAERTGQRQSSMGLDLNVNSSKRPSMSCVALQLVVVVCVLQAHTPCERG